MHFIHIFIESNSFVVDKYKYIKRKELTIANTNTKTNENVFDDEIVGAPDVGIDIVSSSSKPDDIVVLGLDQMKI